MAKKAEEIRPLVLTNEEEGKTITIEFNKAVILRMEDEGFSGEVLAEKAQNAPMTAFSTLFYYGMLMHQPETRKEEAVDFFFDNIGADDEIMERLTNLFTKPYQDMMTAKRKNSRWAMK